MASPPPPAIAMRVARPKFILRTHKKREASLDLYYGHITTKII